MGDQDDSKFSKDGANKTCDSVITKSEPDDSAAQMLKVVIHDIASPLMTTDLAIRKMKAHKSIELVPEILQQIGTIERSQSRITQVLERAKTIVAVNSGKLPLKLEIVNLNELTRSTIESFKEITESKKIQIKFFEVAAEFFVETDPLIFRVVILGNLLSNAIKFSDSHSVIDVGIYLDFDHVYVEVRDRGIGISQDKINELFSSETPTTRRGTRGETGSGFGLPLVKQFTDRLGGSMSIQSVSRSLERETGGTNVKLKFPLYKKRN